MKENLPCNAEDNMRAGLVIIEAWFGKRDNYRTELIDFDITHIGLPYNAILGYPALAKLMAATHPSYNLMKMSGRAASSPWLGTPRRR